MAGNKEAFQKAMNQGHSAAWDQEWEKAADYYSLALEEFPNHAQALSSLGLALFEMQDYPTSLQCYEKAAAQAPEDPVPMEKIARIYERMGRLNEAIKASLQAAEMHFKVRAVEKAIENWVRVLSLQPENVNVRSKLAAVYERMGRKSEAVTEYIATASLFQRNGDLTRAIKVIEYAQQMMPDNQEVRLALSMLRSNQLLPRPTRPKGGTGPMRMANVREMQNSGDASSAAMLPAGEYGAASTMNDPIAEARQNAMIQLAALLFDQAEETGGSMGRKSGLSALTRGISDSSGDSSDRTRIVLHLGQAIDSQTQGDTNQAIVELEHAVNLGMNQPAAFFNLGLMLVDIDQDRALRYLQQSVKNPDYALASHLLIGQICEKQEKWNDAATAYLQALALADTQMVSADEAEELLGQYDAIVDSQSSVEDPATLQATCKAVVSQLLRPDWRSYLKKAREHLPPQAEGNPPAPVAEMVLESRSTQVVEAMAQVRQLASRGMLRSALEEALFALQYAPTYLPLHVLIAELLLQDGHAQDAVQKFLVVANLYLVRGEVTRAIRMFRRISQLTPMDLSVRQRLIDLMVAQEKIEDALQEYNSLAELYYSLAELDKARQTYLDALKVAQKSKDNRNWGVKMLLKVADIDLQRLNFRQALRIFEQIRTIQPDNTSARTQIVALNFRLGQEAAGIKELDEYISFLDNLGRREAAINFVNDLLVDHANRLDLRKRLADLHIRSNQIPEAVVQLDTCADALHSAGRLLEAVNMLETIISLRPPNVDEYRAALESLRRDMLRK